MISFLKNFIARVRRPSPETVRGEQRLAAVERDDVLVNNMTLQSRQIRGSNHLGPLIAELFEGKQRHR